MIVDLTVEENARLKVLYGSRDGFHAIDLDSASIYDIYVPSHVSVATAVLPETIWFCSLKLNVRFLFCFQSQAVVSPHCIVILPNSNGMQLLLCYDSKSSSCFLLSSQENLIRHSTHFFRSTVS